MEWLRLLKNTGRGIGVLIYAYIASGCGSAGPSVTYTIENCKEDIEAETRPGRLEKIKAAKGGEVNVQFNSDGTFSADGDAMTIGQTPGTFYFGDRTKNHLQMSILGDRDGDGNIEFSAQSNCPAPPSTPTPGPTKTPGVGIGTGKHAQVPRGFDRARNHQGSFRVFGRG